MFTQLHLEIIIYCTTCVVLCSFNKLRTLLKTITYNFCDNETLTLAQTKTKTNTGNENFYHSSRWANTVFINDVFATSVLFINLYTVLSKFYTEFYGLVAWNERPFIYRVEVSPTGHKQSNDVYA